MKMNKFIYFTIGLATGSIGTYFLVRKTIQRKADEEIESVVTTFKKRFDELENTSKDKQEVEVVKSDSYQIEERNNTQKEYEKNMQNLGYSVGVDLSEDQDKTAEHTVEIVNDDKNIPYVISEEEFGEIGNEEETLFYYADHVVTDEQDNIISDIEDLIGDCLTQFGEFDEAMYVRNERKETDYIILRSEKNFSDIAPDVEVDD